MRSNKKDKRGFSILEMIVVIGIIVVITLSVSINFSSFGAGTKTSAISEDTLTLIKETRQRSLAVKELGTTGLFPNYGLYFDTATPSQIIIYADCLSDDNGDEKLNNNDNFTYSAAGTNCAGGNGFVKTFTLQSPIQVRALRVSGAASPSGKLYIEFVRPEPTVWISTANGAANVLENGTAEVDIGDSGGKFKKTLTFGNNGLITLK